jgi:hypothetical protein
MASEQQYVNKLASALSAAHRPACVKPKTTVGFIRSETFRYLWSCTVT